MKNNFLKTFFLVSIIGAALIAINSCKKKEPDTETTSATDNTICEGEYSRIAPNAHGIAVGDSGVQRGIFLPFPNSACTGHWIDSADIANGFPVTMMISYGTDTNGDGIMDIGCVDNDGKTRKGTIKAVFYSQWDSFPAKVVMNLDTLGGYWVNDVRYEGKIALTRISATSFTQKVTNGGCWASGWTILWDCDRTLSVNLGDVANPNDDISMVSGTANGTDRNGKTFSVDITTPLKKEMGCRWITAGAMILKLDGKKDRTIDFGDGTCDNKATVSIDGNRFEFALQ